MLPARARVLIVEDDPDIARLIEHALTRAGGIDVTIAACADTALAAASVAPPDLILLDLNLPVLSGIDLCRLLRARAVTRRIAIIMVTARTAESDRVVGLEAGADDYVTKPFSMRELVARVRAALRRSTGTIDVATYRGTHLEVDFEAVDVSVDGRPVRLTRREFELLRYLIGNRNRVLSRDRLLEQVWGFDSSVETRSVDVHIGRLRAKLGVAGTQIETIIGLGYRFVDRESAAAD